MSLLRRAWAAWGSSSSHCGMLVDSAAEVLEHPSVADYDLSSLKATGCISFVKKLTPDACIALPCHSPLHPAQRLHEVHEVRAGVIGFLFLAHVLEDVFQLACVSTSLSRLLSTSVTN